MRRLDRPAGRAGRSWRPAHPSSRPPRRLRAASPRPASREVGGVGEAGGLAAHDAHAGAALATGAQLLDPAVVEASRSTTAGPRRTPRRSRRPLPGRGAGCGSGRTLRSRATSEVLPTAWGAYRTPVPLEPGLVGSSSLTVCDTDTALFLGSGDVPVLATPRVVLLAEQATVQAVDGQLDAGQTTVGYRVQLDHLAPVAGRRRGPRRGRARVGRGPAAHVPGLGEAPRRARRGRPDHPGRRGARPLPRESRRHRLIRRYPRRHGRPRKPHRPRRDPWIRAGSGSARLGQPHAAASAACRPAARADRSPADRTAADRTAAGRAAAVRTPAARQQPSWGDPAARPGARRPPALRCRRARPPGGPCHPFRPGGAGWNQPPGPAPKKRRLTWLWILIPMLLVFTRRDRGRHRVRGEADRRADRHDERLLRRRSSTSEYDDAYDELCGALQTRYAQEDFNSTPAQRREHEGHASRRTTSTSSTSRTTTPPSPVTSTAATPTTTSRVDLRKEDGDWKICGIRER